MIVRLFVVGTVLLAAASATAAEPEKTQYVYSARQAAEIAAHHASPNTPDAAPKIWLATYDAKSKTWAACAGRPKALPQSGFCISIDAKTGHVIGMEIVN